MKDPVEFVRALRDPGWWQKAFEEAKRLGLLDQQGHPLNAYPTEYFYRANKRAKWHRALREAQSRLRFHRGYEQPVWSKRVFQGSEITEGRVCRACMGALSTGASRLQCQSLWGEPQIQLSPAAHQEYRDD